jgi:hypothetical protein
MENTNDALKPKLPGGLNVLTILTFIGCAIFAVWDTWNFLNAQKSYEKLDEQVAEIVKARESGAPEWMIPSPEDMTVMITKGYENRIPLILLSLVGVALCLYGAMQMRKLKKQGYILYLIGELLPFLSAYLFIGSTAVFNFWGLLFLCVALLFILLYTVQRKHLVH